MKIITLSIVLIITMSVGWWLISPLFFDEMVNEGIPVSHEMKNESEKMETTEPGSKESEMDNSDETSSEPIHMEIERQGNFQDADEKHSAQGLVKTLHADGEQFLRFEQFKVTNGPDLYVYLVKEGMPTNEGLSLGILKGNVGEQNYELPKDIDLSEYNKVVIWCKAFNVDFGFAVLQG
ncbi:DM13 domain-containing protein [Bacillus sp. DJP31]|uniref:DM13 domain-containing protein n=1 Tax=Bacillus sp. DJP31 TaxID=3409789 RepID=UPI003BB54A7B